MSRACCGVAIDPLRVVQRRFRAQVDDRRALLVEHASATHGGLGGQRHAFAVPGIGREVHHAHEVGLRGKIEPVPSQREIGHRQRRLVAVRLVQRGERGQVEHRGKLGLGVREGEGLGRGLITGSRVRGGPASLSDLVRERLLRAQH